MRNKTRESEKIKYTGEEKSSEWAIQYKQKRGECESLNYPQRPCKPYYSYNPHKFRSLSELTNE